MKFNIPTKGNKKLEKILEKTEGMKELETLWKCANINAIDRLGLSDHGPTHIKIVANTALKLSRLLSGVKMHGVEEDYNMSREDSEVVIFLASLLHDAGISVHREDHEFFSLFIANSLLDKILAGYKEEERIILKSEVLHAIIAHQEENKPLTKEAGILCIADALDMKEGRARIPFEAGKVDIHSVSALSIKSVEIGEGKGKPVSIKITMSDSAGIFQIDQLLKKKIANTNLEKYIEVVAEIKETGKKIIEKFEL